MRIGPGASAWIQTSALGHVRIAVHDDQPARSARRREQTTRRERAAKRTSNAARAAVFISDFLKASACRAGLVRFCRPRASGLQCAPAMGATVNFTHHFLIAMPAMADPHFSHTLTYVCEHNADGALGIVVNKPIDMTLSSLFEQIDVPLADDGAARDAGAFRRPRAGRSRLRAAPPARQLAIDARDRRRGRAHDVEGRARGGRARRGPERRAGLARATPAGRRGSSSRRSRRTPG